MLYLYLTINIALMAIGQIFFKKSSFFIESNSELGVFTRYLYNFWLYAGILAFGIATLIWIKILSFGKISAVYPLQSIAYVLVAILAFFIFGEKISALNALGILVIIAGIFLVTR